MNLFDKGINIIKNSVSGITNKISSGYNNVKRIASGVSKWINNNVVQPALDKVINLANKTTKKIEKAVNNAIQVGSDALANSFESTKAIAPYTRVAMDVNKKVNTLYWALDYSTEKGWFKEGFDKGGFYRDDKNKYVLTFKFK